MRFILKFKTLWIFLLFFLIFLFFQSSIENFFGVDDPYYHAKHSALIAETGDLTLVRPWINFHFFSYAPTDPWWGYHLLGAFFIRLFGTIWGMKILASILASLVFVVYYFILNDFKIRRPFLWTALFFVSSSTFLFRLLYIRPLVLSMIFMPLFFWMMARRKYYWLFFASAIYIIFYNLAPLAILLAIAYSIIEYFKTKEIDLKYFLATSSGILAGLLLHPSTLNYIHVIFIHFFRVIFLKFQGIELGIGSEVQTIDFFSTIQANILAIVFFVVSIASYLAFGKVRENLRSTGLFLFAVSCFWFVVTLFVPRAIEYWLPLGWIFIAFTLSGFKKTKEFQLVKNYLKRKTSPRVIIFFILTVSSVIIFNNLSLAALGIYERNKDTKNESFQEAAYWLKSNTPSGSMVFYNNWSFWPLLFFYNDHNRYVTGVDPTFLYEYDHRLFWVWSNISRKGYYCDENAGCVKSSPKVAINGVKSAIRDDFGSQYVFITNNQNLKLFTVLKNKREDFERVFVNKDVLIYRLK